MTMGTYPMGENVGKMLDLRGSVHLVRLGARVLPLNGREPSSHHVNEVLSHFEVDEKIYDLSQCNALSIVL